MNTEKLQALITVLEQGSLTAAAERLHFTTSGVSRAIAALEEELQVDLLYRGKDGVRPTPECERLLPEIREMLHRERLLLEKAGEIRGLKVGRVVIGTAYSRYYPELSQWVRAFREKYPGIEFHFRSGFSRDLISGLENREIDLCIVSRREGDFEWKLIKKDEMAAWVPEDHPLMTAGSVSGSPAVPLTVFEQYPYIDIHPGQDTDNARILAANRIHPNVQMETDDLLYAYSMVKAGLGICMSNRLTVFFEEGDVRTLPLDPPQYTEIGLAWRRDASPAAGAFAEFLARQW